MIFPKRVSFTPNLDRTKAIWYFDIPFRIIELFLVHSLNICSEIIILNENDILHFSHFMWSRNYIKLNEILINSMLKKFADHISTINAPSLR